MAILRRVMLILAIVAVLLVIGCSQQTEAPASQSEAPTSMAVPAPGFEGKVDEMIVDDDPSEGMDQDLDEMDDTEAIRDSLEVNVDEMDDLIPESSVKSFNLIVRQWEFKPDLIEVNRGDRVKLIVTSTDVTHSLSLPAFGVNLYLASGKTSEVEFIADQEGSFVFSCGVPCGRGHGGMRGKIVVT